MHHVRSGTVLGGTISGSLRGLRGRNSGHGRGLSDGVRRVRVGNVLDSSRDKLHGLRGWNVLGSNRDRLHGLCGWNGGHGQ